MIEARTRQGGGALLLVLLGACSSSTGPSTGTKSDAVVYGKDDRVEVFEARGRVRELAETSLVALVQGADDPWTAPSWASVDGLCPDVRFAQQPSGATCTGVLAAPDLVLTAGHCARNLDCSSLSVIFGFYYDGPEQPHPITGDDVFHCSEVLDYSIPSVLGVLDFGWLRLDRRADARGKPVTLSRTASALVAGTEVQAIGFGGGAPAKVQTRGAVLDGGEATLESFTTDLDLFSGDSGAPVLGPDGSVVGIAAGGEEDTQLNLDRQCQEVTAFNLSQDTPGERITYAFQAVSSLCESGKGDETLCPKPPDGDASCSVLPRRDSHAATGLVFLLMAAVTAIRRRNYQSRLER